MKNGPLALRLPGFRDTPIRRKLMILTMTTTASALLMTGLGIVVVDSVLFKKFLQRDLQATVGIIADNSTAALAFNDQKAASETLSALRAKPHVRGACIFRLDGTILATYAPQGSGACPPLGSTNSASPTSRDLGISQPIILNGKTEGTLTLFYDLGELGERIRIYGATVLGVLLASSLLAFLLSSKLRAVIAIPIAKLMSATKSVSETGDYKVRAEKLSEDELGVLVDRFNEMLQGIESRERELKTALLEREMALRAVEREQELFRFMAESMPQKIFAASPTGASTYLNKQWMEFTGLSFEEIREWGWKQFIHPADLEEGLRVWQHSIETGEPLQFTSRFRRADGVYRWHLNRARAMTGEDGRITLWIGSSTEIHEQKEKEEELRRANDDLQQFAYSASHDLQEPIRNVAVYSELVAKRYHEILDDDGRQFLGFLREGGRRLATLINDLLAYTRAGMSEGIEAPVNASEILKDSLLSLAEAIRESDAEVTSDALPEAVAIGRTHLQQIFQNLIGNALKYRDQSRPRIHISATRAGIDWCFSVRDNGIGIDPQYKEKIFGVFKRLHHDRTYSGTGIGLAICQRVVQRYGGRIWVESEPGRGSTFFFTLPQHTGTFRSTAIESTAGRG